MEEDVEEEEADEEEDMEAVADKQRQDRGRNRENLRELYDAMLDMMCGVLDRLVGALDPAGSEYIVLLDNAAVDEANFFDEAKAVVRFGDAMRTVDALVRDLASILGFDGGGGGRANALRAKIAERSLAFVNALGKAHTGALTAAIQEEKWTEVRVPFGVLRLVACLTGDSLPAFDDVDADASAAAAEGKAAERYASAVIVHEELFKTVAAGLRYVRSICAFALFVDKLPFAASEAARRGIELSRLFNAMSGRAILGASALQWAGLRSITARHLALASRTVSLAVALAPHVGAPLQNTVAEAQVSVIGSLMQQTEKDLRDHHGQLLAKVMFIMMDRLAVHEDALVALPWAKPVEMVRFETPSAYMTTLAKEATVLHRILWSVLPRAEVVDIFKRVCASYGSHLAECYGALDTGRPWVRQRVTADVAHLHERLAVLDVVKVKVAVFEPIEQLYERFYVALVAADRDDAAAAAAGAPAGPALALPTPPHQNGRATVIRARPSQECLADAEAWTRAAASPASPGSQPPDGSPASQSPLPPSVSAADVFGPAAGPASGGRKDVESNGTGPSTPPKTNGLPNGTGGAPAAESRRFLSFSASASAAAPEPGVNGADAEEQSLSSPLPSPSPSASASPVKFVSLVADGSAPSALGNGVAGRTAAAAPPLSAPPSVPPDDETSSPAPTAQRPTEHGAGDLLGGLEPAAAAPAAPCDSSPAPPAHAAAAEDDLVSTRPPDAPLAADGRRDGAPE
jgi:hypothetical protein